MLKFLHKVQSKFNRLFWKVFLALWVSSLAVMFVTVLVIGQLADKDNIRSKITFKVRLQMEQFVERYESSVQFRKKIKEHKRRMKSHSEEHDPIGRKGLPLITLHDDSGRQILGRREQPKGEKVILKVHSKSGKPYHVAYYLKQKYNAFERWRTFIFSVQALLILLSSTIASLIVSFIVVRPVKELTEHVQRLKSGDLSVRVVEKLSNRGDEIGDFAREFNQMAEYVEGTLKGQQRLFQNVSHELRAPLARLLAASGIIEQQVGLQHPALNRIQLECERLNMLIDELLSLAKLQQQTKANAEIKVEPIIEIMVADSQFSQKNRSINLVVEAGCNCSAQGAEVLLERAIGNVLGNCLKHTNEQTQINVYLSNPDVNTLLISIQDNGPGVPHESLAQLCDPFMRLDTNIDGHGLGLGIAKQAMQLQQGSLTIENVIPNGLRVNLTLKLKI